MPVAGAITIHKKGPCSKGYTGFLTLVAVAGEVFVEINTGDHFGGGATLAENNSQVLVIGF